MVQGQSFRAKAQLDSLAALYAAEAGVAHALEELSANSAWTTGFDHHPTANGRGTYTVRFNTGAGPFEPRDSINNLGSSETADGPRGEDRVPSDSALLVVTGRAGNAQRDVEVLIRRGGLTTVSSPLLASRQIEMAGNVDIRGLASLEGEDTEVRVHSNWPGAVGEKSITWTPAEAADRLFVDGDISAVSSAPDAIDFGSDPGAYDVGNQETGANPMPYPAIDVAATVEAHNSDSSPSITPGLTVIPAGDWYLPSGLTFQGDLVLEEGAQLYVDGPLDVNGSLQGLGSIYVNGDTHFRGDASISAGNRLAVLSKGDIHLEGFDGTQYLEDLPGAAPVLDEVNFLIDRFNAFVEGTETPPRPLVGEWQTLDILGHHLGGEPFGDWDAQRLYPMEINRVGALRALVEGQPDGPTKAFLVEKLQTLEIFCSWEGAPDQVSQRDIFLADPSMEHGWVIECFADTAEGLPLAEQERGMRLLSNMLAEYSHDRLGSSYFSGLLYSNSDILATNQVTVLGAVIARGTGDGGNIRLEGGSSITFLEEFFEGGDSQGLAVGLTVATWAGR